MIDAIVAIDEEQNILVFNPAAERRCGVPDADASGSPLVRLIPKQLRSAHHFHIERYMWSDVSSRRMGPQLDIAGVRADGSEFPIESTISQMVIDGKRQFNAVLRDVTGRRRAEADSPGRTRQFPAPAASLQAVR